MMVAVAVSLAGVAGLLTLALMGGFRQLAEVQLSIAQGLGATIGEDLTPVIPSGVGLPSAVRRSLPPVTGPRIIAILSEGCPSCAVAVRVLVNRPDLPLVVGVLGVHSDQLLQELPRGTLELGEDAFKEITETFRIRRSPVLIVERDGVVMGSAHSDGVSSARDLALLLGETIDGGE